MNKKIQSVVALMIVALFHNISTVFASEQQKLSQNPEDKVIIIGRTTLFPEHVVLDGYYKIAVPKDTADSMRLHGYRPSIKYMQQRTEAIGGPYIWVNQYEFDQYVEKMKGKSGGTFPWAGRTATVGTAEAQWGSWGGTGVKVVNKWVKIPNYMIKDFEATRAGKYKKVLHSSNGEMLVAEGDYNEYYSHLPFYKRFAHSIGLSEWLAEKKSSSDSEVLKSYASVSLPTAQTRQRSRITMPKYIEPTTQKTLERAKKLETPYIPAASAKDSASKALKRAERFGGYQ